MKHNFFIVILSLLFASCAQFVPPTGGKKDIIPPKLVNSIPTAKSLNVNTKKIILEFDEYVDYSSLKQDLLIIPDPQSTYIVKQKGKSLILLFDKDLAKNTTYSFYFRNSIKDLSERNPANNLKIVFSTGPIIDSLSVKGKITSLHTKLPVLNATLALYAHDTSKIKKPSYFIKTDTLGNYSLENLKSNKYRVVAFTDINSNLVLDYKNEEYGFLKDSIHLTKSLQLNTIELYKNNINKNKVKKGISRETEYLIQLDKPTESIQILNTDNLDTHIKDKQTIAIFANDKIKADTTILRFTTKDSTDNIDTLTQKIYFTKPAKPYKINSFVIQNDIKNNEPLNSQIKYTFIFDSPILKFDTTKLVFKTDTVIQEKLKTTWLHKNKLELYINTKAKKKISLFIPSNTLTNIKGDTSSAYFIENPILQPDDLGSISGYCDVGSTNKIIQLLNEEDSKIIKQIQTKNKFEFKQIQPGSYKIKTIIDNNFNGRWDPGNLISNTIPEQVLLIREPIKLKANFDIKNIKLDHPVDKQVDK